LASLLVLDNHPDKMIARGVPPEFVSLATKKIAAVNAAYEELCKERRIYSNWTMLHAHVAVRDSDSRLVAGWDTMKSQDH